MKFNSFYSLFNNFKTKTAINAKISIFVICVEVIIYLLLYNLLKCFRIKCAFKTRRFIAIKNEKVIVKENARTLFCGSLLEICVQSLNVILQVIFVLELVKCSPPRNLSLTKFL